MITITVNRLSELGEERRDLYLEDYEDHLVNSFREANNYELALRLHDNETNKDDYIYLYLDMNQAYTIYKFYVGFVKELIRKKEGETQAILYEAEKMNYQDILRIIGERRNDVN